MNLMFEIDIQPLVPFDEEWKKLLQTAVVTTLTHEGISPPATLSLVLSDDAHLQQLNHQFRQQDKSTDILSFAAPEMPEATAYLGDIIISVPFAERHAKMDGHSLIEELQLLAVHGTLHLLGYDDIEPEEKRKMWAVQTAVLQTLNLTLNIPQ